MIAQYEVICRTSDDLAIDIGLIEEPSVIRAGALTQIAYRFGAGGGVRQAKQDVGPKIPRLK